MLYLRTFGGLSLENGGPIAGAGGQRGRLALLAVLANAGQSGVSRDLLVALFWPDKDTENARGALRNGFYKLRQDTGASELTLGTTELRLNPAAITSDVQELDDALGAGDFERAVARYAGPFLHGIHLHDAPEFERWVEQERARRAADYRQALEQLARAADARGDFRGAAELARRIADADPLSTAAAIALIRAHVKAGDRTAALQFARLHERTVRAELDVGSDPAIAALIQELRAHGNEPSFTHVNAAAPRATRNGSAPPDGAVPDQADSPRRFLPRGARIAAVALAGAVVIVLAAAVMSDGRSTLFAGSRNAGSVVRPPPRTSVVVLPFENLSAGTPHDYFAGGLHSELQTQLSKVRGLTVVRSKDMVGDSTAIRRPLRQIAVEVAAGSVVEASVQVVGNRLRVNVQLNDASTGAQVWSEKYDRTIADAFQIQSDIARSVVVAVGAALTGGETRVLATLPTSSAEAYRHFLQGREYWTRPGRIVSAATESFDRAVALDPEFALAHAWLAEVHSYLYLTRQDRSPTALALQQYHAEAALRLAPDLPEAHLAMGSWYYRGASDYPRALAELRVALEGLPNDVEVWARIGQVHRRMGNAGEALAAHVKTTQLDPMRAELWKELGVTFAWLGRYADAVAAYDRAIQVKAVPSQRFFEVLRAGVLFNWKGHVDSLRNELGSIPWSSQGDFRKHSLELLHADRMADSMLQIARVAPRGIYISQTFLIPAGLYAGWAHQLRDDRDAARRAFASALVVVDSIALELADDARVHAARGLALAGLGRRSEALREADRLRRTADYRTDKFQGRYVAMHRARILAQVGALDEAVNEIEPLLVGPSLISAHALRLDPLLKPLRDHARFRALLAR